MIAALTKKDVKASTIVCFLVIRDQYTNTLKLKNCDIDKISASIYGLAISKFDNEDVVYLFYCGRNWEPINYSCYPSVEAAKKQAEHTFTGTINLWEGH